MKRLWPWYLLGSLEIVGFALLLSYALRPESPIMADRPVCVLSSDGTVDVFGPDGFAYAVHLNGRTFQADEFGRCSVAYASQANQVRWTPSASGNWPMGPSVTSAALDAIAYPSRAP